MIRIIGYIAIFFGTLCVYRPTLEYISKAYPEQLWTFLFTLFATLLGVYLAFRLEAYKANEVEMNMFKRNFACVMSETGENQVKIDFFLKKDTIHTYFNLPHLDVSISKSIQSNPLLYKYTGDEYMFTLKIYIEAVELTNSRMGFMKKDGQIMSQYLEDAKKNAERALYYLNILQMQTQLYVVAYDVKFGPRPGNFQEIMDLLNGKEKLSIEEIQAKTQKIANMGLEEKETLKKQLKIILSE